MLPFTEIEKIAEPVRPAVHAAEWWWMAGLGILIAVGIGVFIWVMMALEHRVGLPAIPQSPGRAALKELKALRRKAAAFTGPAFGSAIADILRGFMHRQLGLPAKYSTTAQLLGRSRRPDEPPPAPVVEAFAAVLDNCDALKFSNSASPAEREAILQAAEQAIQAADSAPPPRILTPVPTSDTPSPPHAIPA